MKSLTSIFILLILSIQYSFCQYSSSGLNWNTDAYGKFNYSSADGTMPYRLLTPPQNDPNQKYPLTIMLHGLGEGMNEQCSKDNGNNVCNLAWGGQMHLDSINKYPGFVVFPQTYSGNWATSGGSTVEPGKPIKLLTGLLDYLFRTYNIDVDRVSIHGLSGGGQGVWEMALRYPHLFAAVSPHSAAGDASKVNKLVYNALWTVQGELDTNPQPKISVVVMDTIKRYEKKEVFTYNYSTGRQNWPSQQNYGTTIYSLIPNTEHEAWPALYNSPAWLGWMYNQDKNRIVVIGRTEITPGETVKLGISPGFDAYEWSSGQTTNEIKVTQAGEYKVRYMKKQFFFSGDPVWSDWTEPVIITELTGKGPFVDAGNDEYLIYPNNIVTLRGQGYGKNITYAWTKISGPTVSYRNQSTNSLIISGPAVGNYTFRLTVTDANGLKAYDDANLVVTSPTSIQTITSFTLVNADTEKDIMTISDGDNIDVSTLPTQNLNIRANTNPATVGSVILTYDGPATTDNTSPYSIFGDSKSGSTVNYNAGVITNATHTITATPYTDTNNGGTKGVGMTIKVNFFNSQIVPASGRAVVKYVLMNADNDTEIQQLKNGDLLILEKLPTRNLNIKVVTNPQTIGSIVSNYDGNTLIDNENPYSVFGNTGADFTATSLAIGAHQLTVTPYPNANGTGTKGTAMTISFNVIEEYINPSLKVVSFTLVNADTEKDIRTINDGDIINLSTLPTQNINIRANTDPSSVGSVVFNYDNSLTTQNKTPYALYGWDQNNIIVIILTGNTINYRAGKLTKGAHVLKATPYTTTNGTGDKGVANTVRFTVVQTSAKMAIAEEEELIVPDQSEEVIFYPNPINSSSVQVKFKEAQSNVTMVIVDMFGSIVYQSTTINEVAQNASFDLSSAKMMTGTYFATIKSDQLNKKIRVIK